MSCVLSALDREKQLGRVTWVGGSGNVEWRDAPENSRCEELYSFHWSTSARVCSRGVWFRFIYFLVVLLFVSSGEFVNALEVLSSSSSPPPPPALVCDRLVTVLNKFNWLPSEVGGS